MTSQQSRVSKIAGSVVEVQLGPPHRDSGDVEQIRMLPELLKDTQANGAQAEQPDLQRSRRRVLRRQDGAVAADDGRVALAQSSHFERHAGLSAEGDGLALHHLARDGERIGEVDLVETLGIGVRGRIVVVDAVDILDQPAARVELLRQEERREIRAATAKESHAVLGGSRATKPGITATRPCASTLSITVMSALTGSVSLEPICGDELNLARIEHLRRNAEAIEFKRQKRSRDFLASGHDSRDRFGVAIAVILDRSEQTIGLAGEGRDHRDNAILPANPAIDFVYRLRQVARDCRTELPNFSTITLRDMSRPPSDSVTSIAARAVSRSAMMSAEFSRPTDSRTSPSVNAGALADFARNITVRHGDRMRDQRLDRAKVFRQQAEAHRIHQLDARFGATLQLEGEHAAGQ